MRKSALHKVGKAGTVHKRMHAIWREIILKRDGGVCRRCGGTNVLQAHHVYPKKTRPRMRYVVENGIALCAACHFWIERVATTFEAIQWYGDHVPHEILRALDLLSRDRSKGKTDLVALELWLTQQLKGAAK